MGSGGGDGGGGTGVSRGRQDSVGNAGCGSRATGWTVSWRGRQRAGRQSSGAGGNGQLACRRCRCWSQQPSRAAVRSQTRCERASQQCQHPLWTGTVDTEPGGGERARQDRGIDAPRETSALGWWTRTAAGSTTGRRRVGMASGISIWREGASRGGAEHEQSRVETAGAASRTEMIGCGTRVSTVVMPMEVEVDDGGAPG